MSLPVPQLDDLDFEVLVEDARARIPRYAREWTDHNVHDPGMTLLDLVAWLVDQQIYQVGFVGDRHLAAFAALLGVRPRETRPARGIIWPRVGAFGDDLAVTGVDVERGSEVFCIEQPDVPFELAADVHITPARLDTEVTPDAGGQLRITAATSGRRAAQALREGEGVSGLVLVFDRPLVERAPGERAQPIAVGIELDGGGGERAALGGRLVVDYRLGTAAWQRVDVVEDGTGALNHTGVVHVEIPPSELTVNGVKTPSQLRLMTRDRVNPHPPRITRAAVNALPIVQLDTREATVVGTANGEPDQAFDLAMTGIVDRSDVRVEVEEEGVLVPWSAVDDLSLVGPEASVFEIRREDDSIVFGNGVNGRRPAAGAQIRHLPYAVSLGDAGNLAVGLTWEVRGAPRFDDTRVYGENFTPLSGGADASDIDELRSKARRRATERHALLTNAHLEDAVATLDGLAVARADVSAGFHPALPGAHVPAARTVFVTPERPADVDPLAPVAARYIAAVEHALRSRRVLGERLSVAGLDRVALRVEASLIIEDGIDVDPVIAAAEARLDARMSDVRVEADVAPWPAGRTVTTGEMQTLLAGVSGVIAVKSCRIARGTKSFAEANIDLAPNEIAIGSAHEIRAEVFEERRN